MNEKKSPGRGRRPRSASGAKSRIRQFRCTDEEWKQLQDDSEIAGKTISEWIRIVMLDVKITAPVRDKHAELRNKHKADKEMRMMLSQLKGAQKTANFRP